MPTETKLSLHRKLAQILHEAERIPKNGTAPQIMGGYKFVQVGDAADFIRKALAEHVLTMMPTKVEVLSSTDRPTKSGGMMTTVDLLVDWTISDGESGESIVIQSFGAGADGGDKYSGKASTSAMKYAFLTGFLLSTGEDAELGSHEAIDTSRPVPGAPRIASDRRPRDISDTDEPLPMEFTGKLMYGKSSPSDGELRYDPKRGPFFGFAVQGDKQKLAQVVATGPIADALANEKSHGRLDEGTTVTVWGDVERVPWKKDGKDMRPFQRMSIARIGTPDILLPSPAALSTEPVVPTSTPAPSPEDMADLEAVTETLFGGEPMPA